MNIQRKLQQSPSSCSMLNMLPRSALTILSMRSWNAAALRSYYTHWAKFSHPRGHLHDGRCHLHDRNDWMKSCPAHIQDLNQAGAVQNCPHRCVHDENMMCRNKTYPHTSYHNLNRRHHHYGFHRMSHYSWHTHRQDLYVSYKILAIASDNPVCKGGPHSPSRPHKYSIEAGEISSANHLSPIVLPSIGKN